MKVGGNRPVGGAPSVSRGKGVAKPEAPGAVRAVSDTTSIMGIPETELTPKVREAIMTLMAEVDRLRQDLEAAKRRMAEIENVADQDPLLPVLNRRAFVRELSRVISYAQRYGNDASLVYFDLNDFKVINDTYGHGVGDEALLHIAQILTANVRESDVVGRMGGDEFAVILEQADEAAASAKAESLAKLIQDRPLSVKNVKVQLSASAGAVTFHPDDDAASAIARADEAMYERKRGRRS